MDTKKFEKIIENKKTEPNKQFFNNGFVRSKKKSEKIIVFDFKFDKKMFLSILISVILFVFVSLIILYFIKNRRYGSYDIVWKEYIAGSNDISGNVQYIILNDDIIRYTNDGVRYFDNVGRQLFNVSYNIKSPIITKCKNYFAVSGVSDNNIYIFDKTGLIGAANTNFPVTKISISEYGTVFAMLDAGDSSIITVFDKNGNPIDITIKSILSSDGMPIDFDISTDGTELVVSYAYTVDSKFKTKVVYYNFDELGKTVGSRRVVAGFENEFDGRLVAKVNFSDNYNSQCFFDGGVSFISTKILTSPMITKTVVYDDVIRSINYSDEYSAVVLEKSELENENLLIVYDKSGNEISKTKIPSSYDSFNISKDFIIFTENNKLRIYNTKGHLKYDNEIKDSIHFVDKKNSLLSNELLIGSSDAIELIILK